MFSDSSFRCEILNHLLWKYQTTPAVHEPLDIAVAFLPLNGLEPTGPVESLDQDDSMAARNVVETHPKTEKNDCANHPQHGILPLQVVNAENCDARTFQIFDNVVVVDLLVHNVNIVVNYACVRVRLVFFGNGNAKQTLRRISSGFQKFLYGSYFKSKSRRSNLDLTAGDGDGGAGGEAGNDRLGDEVDEEAEPGVYCHC